MNWQYVVTLSLAFAHLAAARAADFSVSFKPTRETFSLSEAIEVTMTLTNISGHSVKMATRFPDYVGFRFSAKNKHSMDAAGLVKDYKPPKWSPPFSRRFTHAIVAAGESYKVTFALNRYIGFAREGVYLVTAESDFSRIERQGAGPYADTRGIRAEFEVKIDGEGLREGYIDGLMARAKKVKHGHGQSVRELIELLGWVGGGKSIPVLVEVVRKDELAAPQVLSILRRFLPAEAAVEAVQEVALLSEGFGAQEALAIACDAGFQFREGVITELARSADVGKRLGVLNYLEKQPNLAPFRKVVEAATRDENQSVAKKARELVAKWAPRK